MKGSLYMADNV